ncbi:MAG: hypothetical protein ABI882_11475, partial [Acidobacteriota bacterium]
LMVRVLKTGYKGQTPVRCSARCTTTWCQSTTQWCKSVNLVRQRQVGVDLSCAPGGLVSSGCVG